GGHAVSACWEGRRLQTATLQLAGPDVLSLRAPQAFELWFDGKRVARSTRDDNGHLVRYVAPSGGNYRLTFSGLRFEKVSYNMPTPVGTEPHESGRAREHAARRGAG